MENSSDNITLKTIGDFSKLKHNFFIPSYQRGYRWKKQQVTDLLSDIWDFHAKTPGPNEFYCLQPVIVKNKQVEGQNVFEVIDGQQRLTTIYIILAYMKSINLPVTDVPFSLEYETRSDSTAFLQTMNDKDFLNSKAKDKEDNIDFFYMYSALEFIKKWFEEHEEDTGILAMRLYDVLKNKVKIIWYEVDQFIDGIELFTRINSGKISLTDAELVKALFLKRNNFADNNNAVDQFRLKQLEIAGAWDRIEYSLQNNDFWYFLTTTEKMNKYENRIEFILDMMAAQINNSQNENKFKKENSEHFTFLVFNWLIENQKAGTSKFPVDDLWLQIKNYYMILEEWFENREMYHFIGYLVTAGVSIDKIKIETQEKTKTDLIKYLKDKVKDTIMFKKEAIKNIEDLDYNYHAKIIKNILLLFNIISLQSNRESSVRFCFDKYKTEKWDIEHIHAVNSKMPVSDEDCKEWLREIVKNMDIDNRSLKDTIVNMLKEDIVNRDNFEELYSEILKEYGMTEEENINSLFNLTLLDSTTNKSYKNHIFPLKRKRIIENDKNGIFVPLCTKNVFLKYYSRNIKQMDIWAKDDGEDYVQAIKEVLAEYI